MWSIGNEIPDQRNNPYLFSALNTIVKSEDNTRPVTAGNNDGNTATNGLQLSLDVLGLNYNLDRYEKFFDLKDNANLGMYSSEASATLSSRGEYFFPVEQGSSSMRNLNSNAPPKGVFQVTSYDLLGLTGPPENQWTYLDKFPAVMGEFAWSLFAYLGEPAPYGRDYTGLKPTSRNYEQTIKTLKERGVTEDPSRSSYWGIIDLAGFKKDIFYLYQSRWRPDLPMAHILPHWNWPERKGQVTPVHVFTSGDEAELFLNGKSLGKKKKGEFEYRLKWDDVVYQPGELKVIAYKNGVKWAEDIMRTTEKASMLSMSVDRPSVRSDGTDLVFITVRIEDKNKLLVPRSSNLVNFSVEGSGRIVATDNGDATSHESFQAKSKKAYNGLCLVIVAAEKGATGSFTVKVESKGLKATTSKINIVN
jgi:beta-galactosidase